MEKWLFSFGGKDYGLHIGLWKIFMFSTEKKRVKKVSTYYCSHLHKNRCKSPFYSYCALIFALMSLTISVRSASFFIRSSTRLMA